MPPEEAERKASALMSTYMAGEQGIEGLTGIIEVNGAIEEKSDRVEDTGSAQSKRCEQCIDNEDHQQSPVCLSTSIHSHSFSPPIDYGRDSSVFMRNNVDDMVRDAYRQRVDWNEQGTVPL